MKSERIKQIGQKLVLFVKIVVNSGGFTMLRHYLILFLCCLVSISAIAQPTVQDCPGAIAVCQNTYSQNNAFVGVGNIPGEMSALLTCGTSEVNDVWYVITVQNSGNLSFTITPNNTNDDYDFTVFNLTNANCSQINSNGSLMVGCNFAGGTGITGANGGACAQCSPVIPVQAGETYVINIGNYSQTQGGYLLDFSASTAQIFDNIPPTIDSVLSPIPCGSSSFTFNFSENILCSTVANSDFSFTGPGGPYTVTSVTCPACVAGATYGMQYVLTISPPISTSGTFNLRLVDAVTDLCGNVAIFPDSLTFSINNITTSHSLTQASCFLYDATVTAQGGTPPYSYSWNSVPVQNTQTAVNLPAGTYQCTVTDASGCAAVENVTVTVVGGTLYNSTIVAANCGQSNGSASLNVYAGNGPFSYSWNPAVSGNSPNAVNISSGTYNVTITDVNGCTLVANLVVPSIGLNLTVSNDTTICFGQQAVLSASPGGGTAPYTYIWDNGLGNNAQHTVSPVTNTVYNVSVSDANNCTSATLSIQVQVNSPLNIVITGPTQICQGESVWLNAVATGGDGNYSFTWNNGIGTTQIDSVLVSPASDTQYQVILSDGCNSAPFIDLHDIVVASAPTLSIAADRLIGCTPFTVQFSSITDAVAGSPFIWQFGELAGSNIANPVITFSQSGCVDVTAAVVNQLTGCRTTVEQTCMVEALPSPEADFDFYPEYLNIDESATLYLKDKSYQASFWEWSISDGGLYNMQNPVHTFTDTGYFQVKLKVLAGNVCTDTITKTVYVDFDYSFYIPNAFTPNGDERNDLFKPAITGIEPSSFLMTIFSRDGNQIYATRDFINGWNGQNCPTGVYLYQIEFADRKSSKRLITGSFTLYR